MLHYRTTLHNDKKQFLEIISYLLLYKMGFGMTLKYVTMNIRQKMSFFLAFDLRILTGMRKMVSINQ